MPVTPSYRQPLPKWLTLYTPLFMLVYPLFLLIPALNWEKDLNREYGLMENLTVVFLLAAIIISTRAALACRQPLQRAWLVLMALGSVLFLGEEISWGQHFFGWSTPENWKELNRQRETNLHNLSGGVEYFFTHVARQIFSFGTIVGGILLPFWFVRRQQTFALNSPFFWLWPSFHGAFVALLSNTVAVPNKIARKVIGGELPGYYGSSSGEVKEALLALYILLYVLAQYRNVRASQPS